MRAKLLIASTATVVGLGVGLAAGPAAAQYGDSEVGGVIIEQPTEVGGVIIEQPAAVGGVMIEQPAAVGGVTIEQPAAVGVTPGVAPAVRGITVSQPKAAEARPAGRLPVTGGDVAALAAFGAGAIAIGSALVASRRRSSMLA